MTYGEALITLGLPDDASAEDAALAYRRLRNDLLRQQATAALNAVEAAYSVICNGPQEDEESGSFDEQLFRAAANGDPVEVRRLLAAGAAVSARDASGRTPLHATLESEAAERLLPTTPSGPGLFVTPDFKPYQRALDRLAESVEMLLAAGADPIATDADGRTPLEIALSRAEPHDHTGGTRVWISVVEKILQAGADPNRRIASGDAPLHAAVRVGKHGLVRALLDAGADVNAVGADHQTPVEQALERESEGVAGILLEAGADLEPDPIYRYRTALIRIAVRQGDTSLLRFLVHEADDLDVAELPLGDAVVRGNGQAVSLLLRAGADPNRKVSPNSKPLVHIAAETGPPILVEQLLHAGADVTATHGRVGGTVLEATLRSDALGEADICTILRVLLSAGADPNTTSNWFGREGWTALHYAAAADLADATGVLVDAGADLEHRDAEGKTPLQRAVEAGATWSAAMLRDAASARSSVSSERGEEGDPDVGNEEAGGSVYFEQLGWGVPLKPGQSLIAALWEHAELPRVQPLLEFDWWGEASEMLINGHGLLRVASGEDYLNDPCEVEGDTVEEIRGVPVGNEEGHYRLAGGVRATGPVRVVALPAGWLPSPTVTFVGLGWSVDVEPRQTLLAAVRASGDAAAQRLLDHYGWKHARENSTGSSGVVRVLSGGEYLNQVTPDEAHAVNLVNDLSETMYLHVPGNEAGKHRLAGWVEVRGPVAVEVMPTW